MYYKKSICDSFNRRNFEIVLLSIMLNMYKGFSKVILNRITKTLDENQPSEQAGLRRNFLTLDHIHTIKQIIQKFNEYSRS